MIPEVPQLDSIDSPVDGYLGFRVLELAMPLQINIPSIKSQVVTDFVHGNIFVYKRSPVKATPCTGVLGYFQAVPAGLLSLPFFTPIREEEPRSRNRDLGLPTLQDIARQILVLDD